MKLFIGIIIFFSVLGACSSDELTNYEVGSDFLDSDALVRVIDTFTIKTGSFKLDELVTSSTGRILLGNVSEPNLGNITSQSYFQVSNSFTNEIDNEAIYDSIGFVMNYDRYYRGDTLQPQTYKLYWINETFEPEEDDQNDFFNTDVLSIDEETGIIGQLTFTPRPNRASDSLYIPIDNSIGEEIFNAIQNDEINSSDEFINDYRGITIVPDNTISSHVLGFNTVATENISGNTSLRVYYTIKDGDSEDNSFYMDFVITDNSKLFNNITSDFTSGFNPAFNNQQVSNLNNDSEITINSDDTNDLFYIQGGSGLSASFDIPSIKNLNLISELGTTLGAELTFKPLQSSYDNVNDLQDSLLVFIIDNKNRIQSQLSDIDGNTSFAILNEDIAEFNNYFYSIDVSNFVDDILASEVDLDYRLMVQFNDLDEAVESTVIEAGNNSDNNLKLSINYLNY